MAILLVEPWKLFGQFRIIAIVPFYVYAASANRTSPDYRNFTAIWFAFAYHGTTTSNTHRVQSFHSSSNNCSKWTQHFFPIEYFPCSTELRISSASKNKRTKITNRIKTWYFCRNLNEMPVKGNISKHFVVFLLEKAFVTLV